MGAFVEKDERRRRLADEGRALDGAVFVWRLLSASFRVDGCEGSRADCRRRRDFFAVGVDTCRGDDDFGRKRRRVFYERGDGLGIQKNTGVATRGVETPSETA